MTLADAEREVEQSLVWNAWRRTVETARTAQKDDES